MEINGKIVIFDFWQALELDNKIKLDAIICAYDEALISQDDYHRLAKVNPQMEHKYVISERKAIINNEMK